MIRQAKNYDDELAFMSVNKKIKSVNILPFGKFNELFFKTKKKK